MVTTLTNPFTYKLKSLFFFQHIVCLGKMRHKPQKSECDLSSLILVLTNICWINWRHIYIYIYMSAANINKSCNWLPHTPSHDIYIYHCCNLETSIIMFQSRISLHDVSESRKVKRSEVRVEGMLRLRRSVFFYGRMRRTL